MAQQTKCYTVCGPCGAWIKSWDGHTEHDSYIGSAEKALADARKQARDRDAAGFGIHTIEERTWNPNNRKWEPRNGIKIPIDE